VLGVFGWGGLMGITFVSIFATIIALYKYLPSEEEPAK